MKTKEQVMRKILMVIAGTIVIAFGCGLLKFADLGIDPYNAMVTGVSYVTKMEYGFISMIVAGSLLVIAVFLDKHYIGFATVLNVFFFGYIVQYSLEGLQFLLPEPSMMIRLIGLFFALVFISAGASLYITADMGVSGYDAMALISSDKTKVPFRTCRIIADTICVGVGFMLGATIGVATLLCAFCIGPAIEFFNQKMSIPLLNLVVGDIFSYTRKKSS